MIQVSDPKVHVIPVVGGSLHCGCRIITRIVCVAAATGVVTESWEVVVSKMVDVTHAVGGVVGGRVRRQAGLPIPHQHRHRHSPGRRQGHHLQALVLPLPLALVPSVLEPDLHLGRGEFEHSGQVVPLRSGQVPLLLEAALQLVHLRLGEEDPRLSASPGLGSVRILGFYVLNGLDRRTELL